MSSSSAVMRPKFRENLIYVLVWVVADVLLFVNLADQMNNYTGSVDVVKVAARTGLLIAPFFGLFILNNYFLLPVFFYRNKIALYFVLVGLATCVAVTCGIIIPPWMGSAYSPPPPPGEIFHRHSVSMPLIHTVIYAVLVIGANLIISLTFRQVKYNIEYNRLKRVNTECRLDQLKAQINPHFYMNMLNSIHGLVDSDPAKAQDMIVDMSRLMRYMLYDSTHSHIALDKEIEFLKDYMRLMRQRYPGNKVAILEKYPEADQTKNIEVPPLLFLVFIENAFKHGVSYRHDSFVSIDLEIGNDNIVFRCVNSHHSHNAMPHGDDSGIGLNNIRQRLDLIYGSRASLTIDRNDSRYCVLLNIPRK